MYEILNTACILRALQPPLGAGPGAALGVTLPRALCQPPVNLVPGLGVHRQGHTGSGAVTAHPWLVLGWEDTYLEVEEGHQESGRNAETLG